MKKPYICSEDSLFLCHPFYSEFPDSNGDRISGLIAGASVMITAFFVKEYSHEAVYSRSENPCKSDDQISSTCFTATVDPILGVVIIPKMDQEFQQYLHENHLAVAGKISEYEIGVQNEDNEAMMSTYLVDEATFRDIITKNYDKFNISDNYSGQNTSYGSTEVLKEYPRTSFRIGYDYTGTPIIQPYNEKNKICDFYAAAETLEKAQEYKAELDNVPAGVFRELFQSYRQDGNRTFAEVLLDWIGKQ